MLGSFFFINLAKKRAQGPAATYWVADIRIIIRQYVDVGFPDPVKGRFGTIFLGKPPPVLRMNHPGVDPVKNFAFLLDFTPG
jgi:hypothetical protein